MAKRSNKSLVTPASLATVSLAGWTYSGASAAARAALLAAGGGSAKKADVIAVQRAFNIGFAARRFSPTAETLGIAEATNAEKILYSYVKSDAKSIPEGKLGRRDADQERIYRAGNTAFSRLIAKEGVKSPRAKKAPAGKVAAGEPAKIIPAGSPDAPVAAVPKMKTTRELHAFMMLQASAAQGALKKSAGAKGGELATLHKIAREYAAALAAVKFDD